MHQMFSVNTKREEFRTQQSPVILDTSICMFEENSAGEITLLPGHHRFWGLMRMHTDPKSEAGLCRVCDFEDEMTRDRPPGV